MQGLKNFTKICLDFIDHAIKANKRTDNLYHAYNLISIEDNKVSISYLSEMLEGQVAVLSSGYLNENEAIENLNALRQSALYRLDQNSYLLYPNKELPKFLEKNCVPKNKVEQSALLKQLDQDNNQSIINKDCKGEFHFNGNFNNATNLEQALCLLEQQQEYKELVQNEREFVLGLFEEVFNHKAFTGRSGTFYGYEGLGSIYWHMVSKLHLAVSEVCQKACENNPEVTTLNALIHHFEAKRRSSNAASAVTSKPGAASFARSGAR